MPSHLTRCPAHSRIRIRSLHFSHRLNRSVSIVSRWLITNQYKQGESVCEGDDLSLKTFCCVYIFAPKWLVRRICDLSQVAMEFWGCPFRGQFLGLPFFWKKLYDEYEHKKSGSSLCYQRAAWNGGKKNTLIFNQMGRRDKTWFFMRSNALILIRLLPFWRDYSPDRSGISVDVTRLM